MQRLITVIGTFSLVVLAFFLGLGMGGRERLELQRQINDQNVLIEKYKEAQELHQRYWKAICGTGPLPEYCQVEGVTNANY